MTTNIMSYSLTTLIDYTEIKKKINDILNSQRTLPLKGRYKFKITEISLHNNSMLKICPTNIQFKGAI